MTTRHHQDIRTALITAAFLCFTLVIALPCSLYLGNQGEFTLHFSDLLAYVVPLFVVASGGLFLLLLIFGIARSERALAILFAVALLAWTQANILVWHYGPLDGRAIDWSAFRLNGLFDVVVWSSILLFALLKPAPMRNSAQYVSGLLIALQSLSIAHAAFQAPNKVDSGAIKNYVIDQTEKYDFSTDFNAVLVVLDTFQSDVYQALLNDGEAYAELFRGFTYFPNALAGSNYTEIAVPALLTGTLYDNSVPRSEYLKDAFLRRSVFVQLRRAGFEVDIYPWVGWGNESLYFDESIASNLKKITSDSTGGRVLSEAKAKEVLHLFDLAIFRALPHFLKPYIHNDYQGFLVKIATDLTPESVKQLVSTDNEFDVGVFARDAAVRTTATRTGNVFKYYHLKGTHSPLSVDADLEFTRETFLTTRENYVRQAKACLKSLAIFFDTLKHHDLYDNALILVVGDHGSGESDELYVADPPDAPQAAESPPHPPGRNFRKDKARGLPLVLVKPPGLNDALRIDQTPVSLLDLPATVLYQVGLAEHAEGSSMFAHTVNDHRTRYYGAFEFSANKRDYVGPITIYAVSGDSRLDASWSFAGVNLPPQHEKTRSSQSQPDQH